MNYSPLRRPNVAILVHSLLLRFLPTRITHDEPFGVAVREFSHFTNKIDSQDSTRSLPSEPQSHRFTIQIRINPSSALRMSGNKKGGPLGRSPTLVSWCNRILLGDHVVCPFNQRHENRWVAKLRTIIAQIRFGYTPGTGARATSIDLNVLGR